MSSSELAVRISGVSKSYTIKHNQGDHVTLAEVALDRLRHPLRRSAREEFWALRDIDIAVPRGQVIGLIGRNGAGKSTLLKVISRITQPSTGRIELWGRVGSLLEVGTGFHPELTGRENIYLNGSILGMTRREIDRQFDAIVAFAGVERFLDTPVKRYSSGMYVRLAFAVASHLETEVLLVDEVLAVGDQEFQEKCLGKIREVATAGRTVFFVSHQMASVRALCDRCVGLAAGRIDFDGTPDDAVAWQAQRVEREAGELPPADTRPGSGELRVEAVRLTTSHVEVGGDVELAVDVSSGSEQAGPYFLVATIRDEARLEIAECDSRVQHTWFGPDRPRSFQFSLGHLWLKPGRYSIEVMINSGGVVDVVDPAAEVTVLEGTPYPFAVEGAGIHGAVLAPFTWQERSGPPGAVT